MGESYKSTFTINEAITNLIVVRVVEQLYICAAVKGYELFKRRNSEEILVQQEQGIPFDKNF